VRQALGVNELFRIGFGATLPAGAERVGIESDWLERFGRLLGQHGRSTRVVLHSDARAPSDPQGVLERTGAGQRYVPLLNVVPAWTRYVVLDFRYSAVSDEKRDGVLRLGVNLATGALPDAVVEQMQIAGWLAADGPGGRCRPKPNCRRTGNATGCSNWWTVRPPAARCGAGSVRQGAAARLGRDQERLYAYHNDLHRETSRRLSLLAEGDAGRPREQLRQEAIRREYHAKLEDLSRQYAMRVAVEWVQTLELVTPVQRFAVQIRRRKAERVIHLDWNPLARRLESPACEFSGSAERPRLVCDDALHLVTAEGLAPCVGCGKAFCRACHRERCPRCQRCVH
jgi:hypothetical protein